MAFAGDLGLKLLSPAGPRGRLLIFTYHRVLPQPDPLMPDEPDAATFAVHMEWLARSCRVLPLPEAARMLRAGTLPDRAACVTFDDGYANNLSVALPILQRFGVPATVFVAVDAVLKGIMWNDLAIETVRLSRHELDLEPIGEGRVELGAAPSQVLAARKILDQLRYLPLEKRWAAVTELYARAGGVSPPRLMMTADEVAAAARAGVDVGAHTVSHPILTKLEGAAAREEIEGSFDWVRRTIGEAPKSFAYPNGRPGRDFDATHVAMVRDAGFELAVTTAWGAATARSESFELPRLGLHGAASPWMRCFRSYVASYL